MKCFSQAEQTDSEGQILRFLLFQWLEGLPEGLTA